MQKWRPWETANEVEWRLALERESVIRPLAEEERLTNGRLQEAMLRLGLSRSVIYKLVQRYRDRPQTSSLLPWKRGRDLNLQVLSPKQEELLQACIQEFYLTRERPTVAALMREVKRRFSERQLPTPVYRTVRRRIDALDLEFVIRKREGAKKAREKLGPVLISTLRSEVPLDIVQIDHTLVDVIVVDRQHRKPIGRPWLTLAVDIATRAVMGFTVWRHAEMSEFFVHCGIKYSLDQASWLNSRIAALASEAGERRGTGASIITGGGILKPNTTNAEFVKA